MELEEIQAVWSEMSDRLEKQKKLTNELIMKMTQERYTNKFRTISTFETIGAVICFGVAILVLLNLEKLDTWYLMACGIFILGFLVLLPLLVLRSLHRIKKLNLVENSYTDTLVNYAKAKKNLLLLQQFGMYMSFLFMIPMAAVFSKILNDKDFFLIERDGWIYGAIVVAVIFLFFFGRWGYGCYKSITNSAEHILKELE